MNLETGQRELVGDFPGMTFAPRFSPDGQRVVMSMRGGRQLEHLEMDLRSAPEAPADARHLHRHEPQLHARTDARSCSKRIATAPRSST